MSTDEIIDKKWNWINYHDGHLEYRQAQLRNSSWARKMGFQVREYFRRDLDSDFVKAHQNILKVKLGMGYYLWKPYIIKHALEEMEMGDHLIYCDSGTKIVFNKNKISTFFDRQGEKAIALINHHRPQYQVTKRDAYLLMKLDTKKYRNYRQIVSGWMAFRKTQFVVDFVDEWLRYCCDERIISDKINRLGKPNYKGFVRNHHEQTVLSLLSRKYDIPAFGRWEKMVKRHFFLKNKKRPGTNLNQLIRLAKIKPNKKNNRKKR